MYQCVSSIFLRVHDVYTYIYFYIDRYGRFYSIINGTVIALKKIQLVLDEETTISILIHLYVLDSQGPDHCSWMMNMYRNALRTKQWWFEKTSNSVQIYSSFAQPFFSMGESTVYSNIFNRKSHIVILKINIAISEINSILSFYLQKISTAVFHFYSIYTPYKFNNDMFYNSH